MRSQASSSIRVAKGGLSADGDCSATVCSLARKAVIPPAPPRPAAYPHAAPHQLSYPEIKRREQEGWEDHLARLERHHTGQRRLAGLSYRVVYRVLNAANYGIPQRRERVVIVGFRADLGLEWSFPDETHSLNALLWEQTRGDYWDRHRVAERARQIHERFQSRTSGLAEPLLR